MDFYNTFADNLSRILSDRGYSVKSMAQKMGVSETAALGWCKGVCVPRLQKIPELCGWLNCSADDLLIAYSGGDETGAEIKASWEEIAVIMSYRQASKDRQDIIKDILHIKERRGENT